MPPSSRIYKHLLTLSLLCTTFFPRPTFAAQSTVGSPQAVSAPPSTQPVPTLSPHEAELAAGTEKLYQLTRELKMEIEKTGTSTLSLATVQKAAEIEKLAHRLNDEMKKK